MREGKNQDAAHWLREGRKLVAKGKLEHAIRCFVKGDGEASLFGILCGQNLALTSRRYRFQRQALIRDQTCKPRTVVAASELSHNAAGRALVLWQCYQQLKHPSMIIGCHFPRWGRELWKPLQTMKLPVDAVVVEKEAQFLEQAMGLVLRQPADLVHLSKPRLPAVVLGCLYKWLWGAPVVVDIDDEELCFVGEHEPITLDGLKRLCHGLPEPRELMGPLWTRLAVDLAQRFDGITVANGPLQERYGGTVIPHARDPEQLRPATAAEKVAARQRFGVPLEAKVVLFFGTPRRHKGLLPLGEAVAQLPAQLRPVLVVAGAFPPAAAQVEAELRELLPAERLLLLGNQPFEQAAQVLALADLVVLLSEGEVAAFQSPAKLSDALAMGLPVLVSEAAPLRDMVARGWAVGLEREHLAEQLEGWLSNPNRRAQLGQRARAGFLEDLTVAGVAARLAATLPTATASGSPVALDAELGAVLKALGLPGMD